MYGQPSDPRVDPEIVCRAAAGDVEGVKACLLRGDSVDLYGKWTEREEKYGYDKEWDWNLDTPLLAAVRHNRFEVVKYLMENHFPNPLHSSCRTGDEHDSIASLAKKNDSIEIFDYICEMLTKERRIPSLFQLVAKKIMSNPEAYYLQSLPEDFQRELRDKSKWRFRLEPLKHSFGSLYGCLGDMYNDPSKKYYNPNKAALWLGRFMMDAPFQPTYTFEKFPTDKMNALRELRDKKGVKYVDDILPELERKYASWKKSMAILEEREKERRESENAKMKKFWSERDRKRKKFESRQRAKQLKIDEEFRRKRQAEIERCRAVNKGGAVRRTGYCTNDNPHLADYCTYYHPGNELPPHCMWGSKCHHKETCWFNHLPHREIVCPYYDGQEISSDEEGEEEISSDEEE